MQHRAISLYLLVSSLLPAAAETFTGDAALAKVKELYAGKKLQLTAPGESAEAEFVLTVYSDTDSAVQMAAVGGQRLAAVRLGAEQLPVCIGGSDWTWLPSAEDPGSFLYVPGAATGGFLNGKERKMELILAGAKSQPGFDTPLGCDIAGLVPPEKQDGAEWTLETDPGGWTLSEKGGDKGRRSLFRFDPAAAWPLREYVTLTDDNSSAHLVVQTGAKIAPEWRKLSLETLFAAGRPVRTQQTSRIQWKLREAPDYYSGREGLDFVMKELEPAMKSMQTMQQGGGEHGAEITAARKVLQGLLPALPPRTLTLGSDAPVKPKAQRRDTHRADEWENLSHPLPAGGQPVTVPLKFQQNTPLVAVKIAGGEHLLTLDTGAPLSEISTAVGGMDETQLLKPLNATSADLRAENKDMELRRAGEMHIGAWTLKNAVFSLHKQSSVMDTDEPVRGLLGTDILRLHPFTVDWSAGTLTFYPRESFQPPAGVPEVPLTNNHGRPAFPAKLDGAGDCQPILDTGFTGVLAVTEAFRQAHAPAFEGLRAVNSALRTPSGYISQRMWIWPQGRSLEAAGIRAAGGFSLYEIQDNLAVGDGIVGASFFTRARVTFDLEKGRLWVQREPSLPVKERLAAGWKLEETDASGLTPLGRALTAGNLAECEALAAAGASLKVHKGMPAMLAAVMSGNPAVVEWLAAQDKAGTWKNSPALTKAIAMGAPDIARWLLEQGIAKEANPNAMMRAAETGDVATAKLLQKAGYAFTFSLEGTGLMHVARIAIEKDQAAFLKWLTAVDKKGLTDTKLGYQLLSAASREDPACLNVLLDAGLDPLFREANGNTAVHIAAGWGRMAALELLLAKVKPDITSPGRTDTPLLNAVISGQSAAVKLLLAKGAAVEGPAKNGEPLYYAALCLLPEGRSSTGIQAIIERNPGMARLDYAGCFRELLASGANPLRRSNGTCPAEISAAHSLELAKLCLDKGATPANAPLMINMAAEHDRAEIVSLMLTRGWKGHTAPRGVDTPLFVALKRGSTGVVRALMEGGTDVTQPPVNGVGVLHAAARHNDGYLIHLLAKAGADMKSEDEAGFTPLATAIEWRTIAAARALIEAGADPQQKSGIFTPLEAARHLDPKYPELEAVLQPAAK